MNAPRSRRRALAALGMIFGPAVMLAGDVQRYLSPDSAVFRWSLFLQLAMMLLLLAVLGMVEELRPVADRAGLAGGLLAGCGLFVGTAMQGFFRTWQTAVDTVPESAAAIDAALTGPDYLFSTRVPGITFPVGMLILAVALTVTRRVPAGLGLLIAAGAVIFPVGRIGGLWWAILASNVCFLLGLGWMAVRTLRGASGVEEPAASGTRIVAA